MKKKILLFTASAGMGFLVLTSYINGPAAHGWDCTGAETACTGTYINYTGCSTGGGCHSTSVTTTIDVNIELDSAGIATTHYIGGNTYTVKISANNGSGTTFPYLGFELTSIVGSASAATVSNAGTWASPTGVTNTVVTPPYATYTYLNIVEHNDTIPVSNDTFSRSFTWTAPVAGTGTISFWAAVNFVNGTEATSGSPSISGDLWNTNHLVITELGTTSVTGLMKNISIKAFPNPVINNLCLQMDNTQTGTYSLQVVDMSGRTITSENVLVDGTGNTIVINTANWLSGTYNVVIEKDGNRQVIQVMKL